MTHTDAGWAWVVLGSSAAGLFLSGLQRYFVGVMHAELLREYRASNTTTAWVGALYVSLMALGGPLASAVIGRYGCRVCCIVGAVFCFLGFGASAFTTSITQLFFTYGVVAGLGLGLTYSPSVLSVGYYFNRLLPMASGLASGASAIGMLCGPVLIQTLVNEYRVSGGFLLLAAISLHHCVCGMLFRPNALQGSKKPEASFEVPGPSTDRNENDDGSGSVPFLGISLEDVTHPETVDENGTGDDTKEGLTEEDTQIIWRKDPNQVVLYNKTTESELKPHNSHKYDSQDVLHNKPEDSENETCCLNQHTDPEALDTKPQTDETGISCLHQCKHQDVLTQEYKTETSLPNQHTTFVNQDNVTCIKIPNSELSEDANTSLNSQELLKLLEKQEEGVKDSEPIARDQRHSRYSEIGMSRSSNDGSSSKLCSRLKNLTENYRVVLSNTAFTLYYTSLLLSQVHQAGVFLHLPEYVQTLGTPPTQAAQLFIAAGCGSLVSRVGSGLMTTDSAIDPLVVSLGMCGLAGLATVLLPLYSATYAGQIVFCLLMGLYTGGLASLLNVLTKRLVGLPCLHTAFGFSIFFCGVGAILGPLLAALVVDYGGKYEHSFVILGSVMLMASFLDLVAGVIFLRQKDSADVDKTEEI